ncbi:MAG: ABC transporter permease [Gaiellaceae bacterium]
MTAIGLLLGKDARTLARSRPLAIGLVLYPLLIALVVGLLVRYAGQRPMVALVDEGGLPPVVHVGDRNFDVRKLLEDATEVRLVRMTRAEADRELQSGRSLATLVVPADFSARLGTMRASPKLVLRTTSSGLSTRVVEKVRALVYSLNLELQQSYIRANLAAVDLLLRGGSGRIGDTSFTLLGLARAQRDLARLARSPDPAVAARAAELSTFVRQLRGAVGKVGVFLRATANPVVLETETSGGRGWLLSAQIQVYALALTLAFVTTLLGAAAVTAEREDATIGRLARGVVPLGRLVAEKVAFATLVAVLVASLLAVVFGAIVELGGVAGGEPWARIPLLVLGLVLAAAAFAAFGVLVGVLGRDSGTAMLLAFLVALPLSLLGVVPHGAGAAARIGDLFPFGHAAAVVSAALYDARPLAGFARAGGALLALAAAFGLLARLAARRLVV